MSKRMWRPGTMPPNNSKRKANTLRTKRHICPACGQNSPNEQAYRQHWKDKHRGVAGAV